MTRMKRVLADRYERDKFKLSECDADIQIIGDEHGPNRGYGTVFLNVTLPDGRWVSFRIIEGARIPLYRKIEDVPILREVKAK